MRRLLPLSLALTLFGCVAVKYDPRLSRHPAPEVSEFLASSAVRLELTPGTPGTCDARVAAEHDDPTAIVRVTRNESPSFPGRGFQCFEPLLYVLTLGLVPADCTNDFQFSAVVEREGRSAEIAESYRVVRIQGWVAGILPLFPGWEFGFDDSPCRRALQAATGEYLGVGHSGKK